MSTKSNAPIVTWDRHRMQQDGRGITTLVCFHSCTLRCRYCLNPFALSPDTKVNLMTPQQLYERVRIDDLYFVSTGGGVTFGGGEPLLYPDFIVQFRQLCGKRWHICAETALNVPWENVEKAAQSIDVFYIDCKDMNPEIYRNYTGADNARFTENLQRLVKCIPPERIVVRLPLIPGFNTEADRDRSKAQLAPLGITNFDLFTYITDVQAHRNKGKNGNPY